MKRKVSSEKEKEKVEATKVLDKEREEVKPLEESPKSIIEAFESIPVVGKKEIKVEKVVSEPELEEEYDPNPLIKWKKSSRGSTVLNIGGNDVRIKQNQIFEARENEVPSGFRDGIQPIHPEEVGPVPIKVTSKFSVVPHPEEDNRFNVVPPSGKPLNTKPLTRDAALKLLGQVS